MSIRSRIAMAEPTDDAIKITSIYCHHDGDPTCVGQTLYDHYNNPERVERLMALGDISSLHPHLSPEESAIFRYMQFPDSIRGQSCWKDLPPHSFDTPYPDVTIAYGRDRGQKNMPAETGFVSTSHTFEDTIYLLFNIYEDIDWAYLYYEGIWFASHDGNLFTPLRGLLK